MDSEELNESIEMVQAWIDGGTAPNYLAGALEEIMEAAGRYSEMLD